MWATSPLMLSINNTVGRPIHATLHLSRFETGNTDSARDFYTQIVFQQHNFHLRTVINLLSSVCALS